MKKKSLLLLIAASIITISAFAASGVWYRVSDSCNKCVVNDIDRICGKCKGFLNQDGESENKGDYLESKYKCNNCPHTCTFKVKYK